MKWISLSELSTSKNIIHFKMRQLMCYPEQWHPKAGSKVPHLTIIARPTICTNSTNWRSWPQYFIFILIPPDLMLRLDWSLEKKLMNVEIEFGLWGERGSMLVPTPSSPCRVNLNYSRIPVSTSRKSRRKFSSFLLVLIFLPLLFF